MSFKTNIFDKTRENENFRQVLFTGAKSQLVVMSIPPGGEVGVETHPNVEQALFFLDGSGEAILDGASQPVFAGDAVVVTPGTEHNFRNTGTMPLKIFTLYAPANHIDGRVHETIEEAMADTEDEEFGHSVS